MYIFSSVCFVIAASFVAKNDAAVTDAQKTKIYSKLVSSGLECMRDYPLNIEQIQTFRNKKVPDDEVSKCFVYCIYKHIGIMENGKLSEEKTRKAARRVFKEGDETLPKADEIIDKCLTVNDAETSDGDKGCDRAKLTFECFVAHAPELGLDMDF